MKRTRQRVVRAVIAAPFAVMLTLAGTGTANAQTASASVVDVNFHVKVLNLIDAECDVIASSSPDADCNVK